MMTEEHIPDILALAEAVTQNPDWKQALDSVMAVVRPYFFLTIWHCISWKMVRLS